VKRYVLRLWIVLNMPEAQEAAARLWQKDAQFRGHVMDITERLANAAGPDEEVP
jgi:hypothetical protein